MTRLILHLISVVLLQLNAATAAAGAIAERGVKKKGGAGNLGKWNEGKGSWGQKTFFLNYSQKHFCDWNLKSLMEVKVGLAFFSLE